MKSKFKMRSLAVGLGSLLIGTSAFAATGEGIGFTAPETLNTGNAAFKTKLIRMSNGMLVSAFGDSVEGAGEVYGLKADALHPVRDIYVRTCMPSDANGHCDEAADWSDAVNVSNTALLSSSTTAWKAENDGFIDAPFPGDSDKPNIFNAGTTAVVSWTDKYCPGDKQRSVEYYERNSIELPFSCVYVAYNTNVVNPNGWVTKQLSEGVRDAKQDVNKGVIHDDKPKWIVTWQEDPQGLQIGGGDGPGDGASGAAIAHGTDIWYAMTPELNVTDFSTPARLTDNFTQSKDPSHGDANPVYEHNSSTVLEIESGSAGASRANTAIVNASTDLGETQPTVVVTYEETKGTGGLDDGKYVRYHTFPFNAPVTLQEGDIISKSDENARRVRFVTQVNPHKKAAGGIRMGIFWRQGNPTAGGPGDIMVRLGMSDGNTSGLEVADMTEAVNISSNTTPWSPIGGEVLPPENNLSDATDLNPYEDSRAHRAQIRGADFYIGYSYTKDWAIATYTDLDNYNFWMRRYDATKDTWHVAQNLSNITDTSLDVKEPRLVGMPGSNLGKCPDPSSPANQPDPEFCQNKARLIIAWGMAKNGYEHIGDGAEYDIHYTRTNDKAQTFEPITVVEGIGEIGDKSRFESQLRPTPAGNYVFSVWNESDNVDGGTFSKLSVSTPTTPPVYAPDSDIDDDGIDNNEDADDDNDGVLDEDDAFPEDPNESIDTDGDGIGNNADTDDDNDGVLDEDDAFPTDETESVDTDGDGIGNNADTDDDNDGIVDSQDPDPLTAYTSGGGCTYNPNGKNFDMSFLMMIALGLLYPFRRRFIK